MNFEEMKREDEERMAAFQRRLDSMTPEQIDRVCQRIMDRHEAAVREIRAAEVSEEVP